MTRSEIHHTIGIWRDLELESSSQVKGEWAFSELNRDGICDLMIPELISTDHVAHLFEAKLTGSDEKCVPCIYLSLRGTRPKMV